MSRSIARPLAAGCLVAATLATTSGCVVVTGTRIYGSDYIAERYYTNEEGMNEIVAANKKVRLGMSQAEVMSIYPDRLASLMSSATVEGENIEEWRVQAYEGTRKHVKSRFVRWLYFSNGELVRMSPDRTDLWTIPEGYSADASVDSEEVPG